MQQVEDRVLWDHAIRTGAVLITKDEDFATRIAMNPGGPAIVWIRIGNTTRQELLRRVKPLLSAMETALVAGEKLIEIV